jgi:hypothetical protein
VPGLGYTYHHDTIKVFYHNVPYNKWSSIGSMSLSVSNLFNNAK